MKQTTNVNDLKRDAEAPLPLPTLGDVVVAENRFAPLRQLIQPFATTTVNDVVGELRARLMEKGRLNPEHSDLLASFFVACDRLAGETVKRAHVTITERVLESTMPPLGQAIDMSVNGLLSYFHGLVQEPNLINTDMAYHTLTERSWVLSGREEAVASIVGVMKDRLSLRDRLKGAPEHDRTKFPVMVCCGQSGLGKTRMLEEWDLYFDGARVLEPRAAVLILYDNEHRVMSLDGTIGWEASMAWRFLHRVFLERNCRGDLCFNDWFQKHLPMNARDLSLQLAIETLRAAMAIPDEQKLSVFLGIDEYHKIGDLDKVLECLVGVSQSCPGCEVFVMMAGFEWGRVVGATPSNVVATKRIPMRFLSLGEAEKCLGKYVEMFSNNYVQRYMFDLGGVPRYIIRYAEGISDINPNKRSDTACAKVLSSVMDDDMNSTWIFPSESDRIRLVAWALSGKEVDLEADPGVFVVIGKESYNLTWRQMADLGFCLIQDRKVHVPYWLVKSVGQVSGVSVEEKAFAKSISSLCFYLDEHLLALSAWQSWGRFGAYFHALRINALLVVEKKSVLTISLQDLFLGSRNCLDSVCVVLVPMVVERVSEEYDMDLPKKVSWLHDCRVELNWTEGGVVCIGRSQRKSVDSFFALKRADGQGIVLIVDQRKCRGTNVICEEEVRLMVDMARVVPEVLAESQIDVVVCVFHLFACTARVLQLNCLVVSEDELERYYGFMASHPASDPKMYVRDYASLRADE